MHCIFCNKEKLVTDIVYEDELANNLWLYDFYKLSSSKFMNLSLTIVTKPNADLTSESYQLGLSQDSSSNYSEYSQNEFFSLFKCNP